MKHTSARIDEFVLCFLKPICRTSPMYFYTHPFAYYCLNVVNIPYKWTVSYLFSSLFPQK